MWNLTSADPRSARLHIWQKGEQQEENIVKILVMACARIFCSSCLVSGRRDKVFTCGKVEKLSRPPVFSCTWDEFITSCKFIKWNKWKVSSPWVTWGESCMWYLRLCKWVLLCNRQLASSKTQTFYRIRPLNENCVTEIVTFASCQA